MTNSPSAVVYGGKLYVFHHDSGNDGRIWYNVFNGTSWEGDKMVPNAWLKGSPNVVVYQNKIVIFHRAGGDSNDLWSIHFDGSSFQNKKCEGIRLSCSPAAIVDGNSLRVFYQDHENKGYIKQSKLLSNWTWQKDLHLVNFHQKIGGFQHKKFKDFTLPSTHNSYTAPPLFIGGNNNSSEYIPHQLDQGIRFIEVDPNYSFFPFNIGLERNVGVIHGKYYGSSVFGQRNPTDVFREIKNWLDQNSSEMIILKIDSPSGVSYSDLKHFLQKSGLYNKLYTAHADWAEMRPIDVINAGKQVVMFGTNTGDMASNMSGQMGNSVAWGGDAPENQNPTINNKSKKLYVPAMYCTTSPMGFGSTSESKIVNEYQFAKPYIMKGWRASARRPFAFVHDFSMFGDVMDVVYELNNCYNSIRGKVVDQDGNLISDVHFACHYSSDGKSVSLKTPGTFDFPVKQGETVSINITKSNYQFDQNAIAYHNANGQNLELVITATTPSAKSAKVSLNENGFTISPNPFTNTTQFNYSLANSGNVSFCCYDTTGRIVGQKQLGYQKAGSHSFEWTPEKLDKGVYIVVMNLGNQQMKQRIVKR
jgi:hypothetical protein